MGEKHISELAKALDTSEEDLGFLAYLPQDAVANLAAATQTTLENERASLDTAIEQGTQTLPIGLKIVARSLLR